MGIIMENKKGYNVLGQKNGVTMNNVLAICGELGAIWWMSNLEFWSFGLYVLKMDKSMCICMVLSC